jgi:hypothetical protein
MAGPFHYLEGKKFCVVFVKVLDAVAGRVKFHCLHGRANVDGGRITCIRDDGVQFTVPGSAIGNILPADGTPMLKDAEYFVLVRADSGIDFTQGDEFEDD